MLRRCKAIVFQALVLFAIYGHTDNVASDSYNLDLSRRTAVAIAATLSKRYGAGRQRLCYPAGEVPYKRQRRAILPLSCFVRFARALLFTCGSIVGALARALTSLAGFEVARCSC